LIHRQPLVAVTGPSGSGKSSLAYAGLIPRVRQEGGWSVIDFRPGNDPLTALAAGLVSCLDGSRPAHEQQAASRQLAAELKTDEKRLSNELRKIRDRAKTARVLLLVDQFEELYAPGTDENDRHRFLDALVDAVRDREPGAVRGPTTLVLTVRSDF